MSHTDSHSVAGRLVVCAKRAWIRGNTVAQDVAILCENGVIQAVTSGVTDGNHPWRDHASNAIEAQWLLPGFINAHCHLEYTGLTGSLPSGDVPFGDWLDAILEARLSSQAESPKDAAIRGAAELVAGGCTTVADSTTQPMMAEWLSATPLRHYLFHETLGLSDERADDTLDRAISAIGSAAVSEGQLLGAGINPHAPYSCGPHLRERLRALFLEQPGLPCAWHVAETPDEDRLLCDGGGSIASFLSKRGMPLPMSVPDADLAGDPLGAACAFLQREGLLEACSVLFHGNTVRPAVHARFAAPKAIVYCPGTHRYFSRPRFAAEQWLAAGANLCLGTDSKASSPSLSMLDMLRFAAEDFPTLTGPQLINLATANPAKSLLFRNAPVPLGIIQPGAASDFVALANPEAGNQSLRDLLSSPATRAENTVIAGRIAYDFASRPGFPTQ